MHKPSKYKPVALPHKDANIHMSIVDDPQYVYMGLPMKENGGWVQLDIKSLDEQDPSLYEHIYNSRGRRYRPATLSELAHSIEGSSKVQKDISITTGSTLVQKINDFVYVTHNPVIVPKKEQFEEYRGIITPNIENMGITYKIPIALWPGEKVSLEELRKYDVALKALTRFGDVGLNNFLDAIPAGEKDEIWHSQGGDLLGVALSFYENNPGFHLFNMNPYSVRDGGVQVALAKIELEDLSYLKHHIISLTQTRKKQDPKTPKISKK